MAESRNELLSWLNDLLQLNYTKVEHAGTGAAYAQIMDSIYGDVQLGKVKFDAKHEYEYVANFKVLQHSFDKHKVDKIVPVEKLVKCKFQDNLEFMQWIKRYWDQNYQGGIYDAPLRRKNGAVKASAARASAPTTTRKAAALSNSGRNSSTMSSSVAPGRLSASSTGKQAVDSQTTTMLVELRKQLADLQLTADTLERERNFYFEKLQDVEQLVRDKLPSITPGHPELAILKDIENILYTTEEGFEVITGVDEEENETF